MKKVEAENVRVGVLCANRCPELFDHVLGHGRNVSHAERRLEVKEGIKTALIEVLGEYSVRLDTVLDEDRVESILARLEEAGLWDSLEASEDSYTLELASESGTVYLQLFYLGGAAHFWVLESPWVVRCRGCSPCLPGQGNLDEPDEDGWLTYCLPPDWLPEDWQGEQPVQRAIPAVVVEQA